MRSLLSLTTLARSAARTQLATRPISVAATQFKAASAVDIQDAQHMTEADHHSKGIKISSNFDRWVLAKFHPEEYPTAQAVPQYVDAHDYNQAHGQFRAWATMAILIASFTFCGSVVLIYNPLQPHHEMEEVDTRNRQDERMEAYQAFNGRKN